MSKNRKKREMSFPSENIKEGYSKRSNWIKIISLEK